MLWILILFLVFDYFLITQNEINKINLLNDQTSETTSIHINVRTSCFYEADTTVK